MGPPLDLHPFSCCVFEPQLYQRRPSRICVIDVLDRDAEELARSHWNVVREIGDVGQGFSRPFGVL
ncbi:hypothetical protein CYJ95_04690 [Micrococcus luteus]|uniref:Uncharacterized protein n=1 Tax=Micrococcus luteus TaxID=1270 RepID=A0AAX0VLD1_MICLU|nr:hypothetical protein B8X03_06415 [Micrococcus luteus]PKZ82498.1 hypothetical protein CYJ95_04690 [Micrococcus luteus]